MKYEGAIVRAVIPSFGGVPIVVFTDPQGRHLHFIASEHLAGKPELLESVRRFGVTVMSSVVIALSVFEGEEVAIVEQFPGGPLFQYAARLEDLPRLEVRPPVVAWRAEWGQRGVLRRAEAGWLADAVDREHGPAPMWAWPDDICVDGACVWQPGDGLTLLAFVESSEKANGPIVVDSLPAPEVHWDPLGYEFFERGNRVPVAPLQSDRFWDGLRRREAQLDLDMAGSAEWRETSATFRLAVRERGDWARLCAVGREALASRFKGRELRPDREIGKAVGVDHHLVAGYQRTLGRLFPDLFPNLVDARDRELREEFADRAAEWQAELDDMQWR
jgi:hypothetical protein